MNTFNPDDLRVSYQEYANAEMTFTTTLFDAVYDGRRVVSATYDDVGKVWVRVTALQWGENTYDPTDAISKTFANDLNSYFYAFINANQFFEALGSIMQDVKIASEMDDQYLPDEYDCDRFGNQTE